MNFIKRSTFFVLAFILFLTSGTSVFAGVNELGLNTGNLNGGNITFADFGILTLDGTKQTVNKTWSIADLEDSRGTGEGWNLSLTLTQLAEFDTITSTYVTSGETLPIGSIKVTTAPTVSKKDLTSSDPSTITVISTGTSLDAGSAVKILSAAVDGGMGSFTVSDLTVELSVPADAYAVTYKTDATVALTTGP
jgi:hypothetical protein